MTFSEVEINCNAALRTSIVRSCMQDKQAKKSALRSSSLTDGKRAEFCVSQVSSPRRRLGESVVKALVKTETIHGKLALAMTEDKNLITDCRTCGLLSVKQANAGTRIVLMCLSKVDPIAVARAADRSSACTIKFLLESPNLL